MDFFCCHPGGDLRLADGYGNLQLNPRAVGRAERDLGLDDRFAELLNHLGILGDVDAEVAADVVESDGGEEVVDVVAAEVGIAAGADDLEDAFVELEDGDVEGAAAEVVDGDDAVARGAVGVLVETVGQGSCGGLIH